jgi:integrase
MKTKLTKKLIDSLKAPVEPEKFLLVSDTEIPGFGIRVMQSGTKTFIMTYRDAQHRQHRINIGRYGAIHIEDARDAAHRMWEKNQPGHDPLADRKREAEQVTFAELAEEYIARRCSEKDSGHEDARIIKRDLLKPWGSTLARDVTRRDVMDLTDGIKKRGGVMANRTLAVVRRLYNWGIDHELVEMNPAARMKPRVKEQSRDRVLTSKEIKAFWNNLDKLPAQPAVRAALRLILVTAQRPGEIVNLEWSEINQDEDGATWWTIPSRKSKNNLSHRVPLSGLAIEVLETMPRKDAGFVFASSHNGAKGVTRHALSKALNVNQELMSIEDFHPHDLRRSAASYMTGMGISRLVVSKILNHVETGITAVYDRHAYDAEKRTALESWAVKLGDILEGRKAKVLPLAR